MMKKEKNYILQAFVLNFLLGLILVLVGFALGKGTFYLGSDFNYQQIPFNAMAAEAIKTGNVLWLDNFELGASFIGALSFYVIGSPFFWLSLLIPSANYAIVVPFMFTLKFAVAGTGAYCYGKQYIKDNKWALIASMLYAFSGYQLANMNYNHFLDVTAIFPFLLLALDMNVKKGKKGWFAFTVALMALTNYFFFVAVVVFLIIYFVVNVVSKEYVIDFKIFRRLAFESIIGVGIAMILLLPNVFFVMANPRVSESIFSLGWFKCLFLKPHQYADLLHAMLLPAESIFLRGFILEMNPTASELYLPVIGLIPMFAFMVNHKKDWMSKLSMVCFVFMFVPVLNSIFTAFNMEYYPRWFFMPLLIFAVMSARQLESKESLKNGFKVWAVIVGLFIFARLMWKYYFKVEFFPNKLLAIILILLAFAGVVTLVFLRKIKDKKIMPLILVLAIFCQTTVCFALNTYYSQKYWNKNNMPANIFFDVVPEIKFPDEDEYYRLETTESFMNVGVVSDKPAINIFASNITGSVFEFYKSCEMTRSVNSRIYKDLYGYYTLLGTKYIMMPENKPVDSAAKGFTDTPVWKDSGFELYENENFIGMGFAYDKAMSEEEFAKIEKDKKHLAIMDAIVIDTEDFEENNDLFELRNSADYTDFTYEDMENSVHAKNSTSAQNFEYEKGKYTFDTTLGKDSIYYVAIPYDEGFTVCVNGEKTEKFKVNNGFVGFLLEEGENHVEISYMPSGLKAGAVISALSTIALCVYAFVNRRKSSEK